MARQREVQRYYLNMGSWYNEYGKFRMGDELPPEVVNDPVFSRLVEEGAVTTSPPGRVMESQNNPPSTSSQEVNESQEADEAPEEAVLQAEGQATGGF